jgi:histidyl-tRNA synthetase
MEKISSKPVRGARDILPAEMRVRDHLEQTIAGIYRAHGFSRIETPALENIDLLLGSEGGDNLKMLFTILKRGDKLAPKAGATSRDLCDMGLRYDLTLPLSRFYANNAEQLELPFKAIQIGNVFRAERPQKGRFRAFKQCDIDIIGDPDVTAEIELIATTAKALMAAGFDDFTIKVNDRRLLTAFITAAGFNAGDVGSVCISLDKADKIGTDGVKAELAEKGYDAAMVSDFVDAVAEVNLDNIDDRVDGAAAVADLKRVIETTTALAAGRYRIEFDFTLIRGMGYYTGQVFEVRWGDVGYSIAGGGRYDNMIGRYTKTSVPAVGFSIGFERIVGLLMEREAGAAKTERRAALFHRADADMAAVIAQADALREAGYSVNLITQKKKLGKQIGHCEAAGYAGFMVFGRDEAVKAFDGE